MCVRSLRRLHVLLWGQNRLTKLLYPPSVHTFARRGIGRQTLLLIVRVIVTAVVIVVVVSIVSVAVAVIVPAVLVPENSAAR